MPFFILIVVADEGTAEGEAVFVPPHATHLRWNDTDEPAGAILIVSGDRA